MFIKWLLKEIINTIEIIDLIKKLYQLIFSKIEYSDYMRIRIIKNINRTDFAK